MRGCTPNGIGPMENLAEATAMLLIPIIAAVLAAFVLAFHEIPAMRGRLKKPDHPYFILLEVGFIVGLGFISLCPCGLLFANSGIWQAALMTGLTINGIA